MISPLYISNIGERNIFSLTTDISVMSVDHFSLGAWALRLRWIILGATLPTSLIFSLDEILSCDLFHNISFSTLMLFFYNHISLYVDDKYLLFPL